MALIESLSGAFANTGEAVYRNLYWAMERVNARGGVALPVNAGGPRLLALERYDSKGQNEEALSALRAAIDDGAQVVLQGSGYGVLSIMRPVMTREILGQARFGAISGAMAAMSGPCA